MSRSCRLFALMLMGLVLWSCEDKKAEQAPAAVAPAPAPGKPASGPATGLAADQGHPRARGTITGTVAFSGKAQDMPLLKREVDPFCGKTPMKDESILVNSNGTLRNVLIYVSEGPQAPGAPPQAPVIFDQRECMYRPRVAAAMVGQQVLIKNGDQTLHNVHAFRGPGTIFNKVQRDEKDPAISWQGSEAGTLLKLHCDVHPWMTGYVYVTDNPYHAVTGEDGRFTLTGVPEGSYAVHAWHERLGTKTARITVQAGQETQLKFTYTGQEMPAPQ